METVAPGTKVLTPVQIKRLQELGQEVESLLGNEPYGWDIEWGITADDRIVLLQARPNM